jgi:hypothetical protein
MARTEEAASPMKSITHTIALTALEARSFTAVVLLAGIVMF